MNPQTTLRYMFNAYNAGAYEDAAEFADVLREWLEKGGSIPQLSREQLLDVCNVWIGLADYRLKFKSKEKGIR